jgi:hypothetical protein
MAPVPVSASTLLLNYLDGIAVRVGNPSRAEAAIQEIVNRREQRRTFGGQRIHGCVCVLSPEHDLDPAPVAVGVEAVPLRGLDGCNAKSESIQLKFDMGRRA